MSTEAAVSYAALILADSEQEITSEKILNITKAAGSTVDSIWADVFAKALEGKNLKELLFSFAASAPAASGAAASTGAAQSGAAEESKEEAKEEEAEESDDDMGFGLFD